MKKQDIFMEGNAVFQLPHIIEKLHRKKVMVVCKKSMRWPVINDIIHSFKADTVFFTDFGPNPDYSSVIKGLQVFQQENCDAVLAVGGGSAMDVAKCIKLYAGMDSSINMLQQRIEENDVKLIVLPATAGSGSEATRFAVIYQNGEKQSIVHDSILPDVVILFPDILETLPDYQRKSTMLDGFCHSIEAFWSIHSTEESRSCSAEAIQLIMKHKDGYLNNTKDGNRGMMIAANMAGRAINLAQTTAAHAMCYKITSLYGLSHGHAAALCLPQTWRYMNRHMEQCVDARGEAYLRQIFREIASCMGCSSVKEALLKYRLLLEDLHLPPLDIKESDLDVLVKSVNPTRLKNNPVGLSSEGLREIYSSIRKHSVKA